MKVKNYLSILAAFILSACSSSNNKIKLVWQKNLPIVGSQSSPRTEDFNKDGTLDIVIGAGQNEFEHSDMGVLAFNGKTGDILWKQEAPDQVFGSATLIDVTGDGVKDVFIGGRSPQFRALDGTNGSVIWQYQADKHKNDSILQYARFNFNNSVIVPDQNNDGISDLLTINGGNAAANPYSTKDRYPGVLMLIDSKTGATIGADTMPDGKESYMTPLAFTRPGSAELNILFGTGGETLDGGLYVTTDNRFKGKEP